MDVRNKFMFVFFRMKRKSEGRRKSIRRFEECKNVKREV